MTPATWHVCASFPIHTRRNDLFTSTITVSIIGRSEHTGMR
jgi:hypothetical protein